MRYPAGSGPPESNRHDIRASNQNTNIRWKNVAQNAELHHGGAAMMIVADNLHVINQEVAEALDRFDPGPIVGVVSQCEKAGAQAIDINSGPLPRSPEKSFSFLVETVQSVSSLPLILDTANPQALEAGLRVCRKPAVINGFSLEPHKLERILPLAAAYEADIIGYLLGPGSVVPFSVDEMMSMAVELFDEIQKAGIQPQKLIVDPVIVPVSWDDGIRHNRAVLSLLGQLPELLGQPVRTIAGVSNLASGPMPVQRKIELECAFLPMLAAAGLDMALLNVSHAAAVQTIKTCDALLGQKVFA